MLVGAVRVQWKVIAFAALACVIVGAAVLDSPSSTASASEPSAAVDVTLSLGTAHSNSLTALAPGDTFGRAIDISLSPRLGARVALTITSVGRSSGLDTDATDGLMVAVSRCDAAAGWRKAGGSYTCPGRVTRVLTAVSVAHAKDRRLALSALMAGRTEHVLVSFQLPRTAGNAFEDVVSSLRLTFSVRS